MEFAFTNINKELNSKKYSFIIDVSNKNYKGNFYIFLKIILCFIIITNYLLFHIFI